MISDAVRLESGLPHIWEKKNVEMNRISVDEPVV